MDITAKDKVVETLRRLVPTRYDVRANTSVEGPYCLEEVVASNVDIVVHLNYAAGYSSSYPLVAFLYRNDNEPISAFVDRVQELLFLSIPFVIEVDASCSACRVYEHNGPIRGYNIWDKIFLPPLGISITLQERWESIPEMPPVEEVVEGQQEVTEEPQEMPAEQDDSEAPVIRQYQPKTKTQNKKRRRHN